MTAANPEERARLVVAARLSIERGSKSFARASRLFDRETRERAWLLYYWCRHCDDLADGQDHGGAMAAVEDGHARVSHIRQQTEAALAGAPVEGDAFAALALVAQECGIPPQWPMDLVQGFAMDADGFSPRTTADMLRYCYHVAGVVGLMMAVVMGVRPADDATLACAKDMGIAFQIANIARDIAEDADAGRCYIPATLLGKADIPPGEHMKPPFRDALGGIGQQLAALAQEHEDRARPGICALPFRARWAVLAAAGIYGGIAREVARRGPQAWDHRVVISSRRKAWEIAKALVAAV